MSPQDRGVHVELTTTFDDFMAMLGDDKRVHTLDTGNIKLTYNSVSPPLVHKGGSTQGTSRLATCVAALHDASWLMLTGDRS